MKERPIIFSGEMVRAILEGRKTQTRRVIKPQPDEDGLVCNYGQWFDTSGKEYFCRHGYRGDRLWIRESFAYCPEDFKDTHGIIYRADEKYNDFVLASEWLPSIFMPRFASRITLEIVHVRVERLQDITEAGARAEGAPVYDEAHGVVRSWYEKLWNSINAVRGFGWNTNPWVWVIEFKRVESD